MSPERRTGLGPTTQQRDRFAKGAVPLAFCTGRDAASNLSGPQETPGKRGGRGQEPGESRVETRVLPPTAHDFRKGITTMGLTPPPALHYDTGDGEQGVVCGYQDDDVCAGEAVRFARSEVCVQGRVREWIYSS